jgi:hypothetical protein
VWDVSLVFIEEFHIYSRQTVSSAALTRSAESRGDGLPIHAEMAWNTAQLLAIQ